MNNVMIAFERSQYVYIYAEREQEFPCRRDPVQCGKAWRTRRVSGEGGHGPSVRSKVHEITLTCTDRGAPQSCM